MRKAIREQRAIRRTRPMLRFRVESVLVRGGFLSGRAHICCLFYLEILLLRVMIDLENEGNVR